ncbi:MAG: hypothetical protein QM713_15635 [Arachnia sp.]
MLETIAPLTAAAVPQRKVAQLIKAAVPAGAMKPRNYWIMCRILQWCYKG